MMIHQFSKNEDLISFLADKEIITHLELRKDHLKCILHQKDILGVHQALLRDNLSNICNPCKFDQIV